MVSSGLLLLSGLLSLAPLAVANTEKTVFRAPVAINIPTRPPTLDSLGLDILTPEAPALRTRVRAEFPDDASPERAATWYLLHNLTSAQRYELRLCWAATQPTSFTLNTYELDTVFDSPELITSLAVYSQRRRLTTESATQEAMLPSLGSHGHEDIPTSVVFLRVLATASYYSDDESRMAHVEPVFVDIILDPYVVNILPRSLIRTAIYIFIVAGVAWFISGHIQGRIDTPPRPPITPSKKTA